MTQAHDDANEERQRPSQAEGSRETLEADRHQQQGGSSSTNTSGDSQINDPAGKPSQAEGER